MASEIDPQLFTPCADVPLQLTASESKGYWTTVWQNLALKRRNLIALIIIASLILFALAGPLLWKQDPAEQNIGLMSQPPRWGEREAVIVNEQQPSIENYQRSATAQEFSAEVVAANTTAVTLRWYTVANAQRYQIYRHDGQPRNASDFGLPLGEVGPATAHFVDHLQLQQQRYFYTVVATDANETALATANAVANPRLAISLFDAQLKDLAPVNAKASRWVGKSVVLPSHPLGTDYLGRDMLARLMHGARTSLFIGICAPLTFILLGAIYGATAGYLGGKLDNVMMRATDLVIALPFLLFMILLKVAFGPGPGDSGVMPMLAALILLSWPTAARLVRAEVLKLRTLPYISAARLMGASAPYLIFRHFAPSALPVILVTLTFAVPSAIFTEAFLSFIGIGVVPPTPSWGSMSFDGIKSLLTHPHELFLPSVFISLTVLSFNLFGDGLRDAMDVKARVL